MNPSLREKKCQACSPGTPPLAEPEIKRLLGELKGWACSGKAISRTFSFKDFHHTMAFVNAVAWIAHRQDHHPDMQVGYNQCTIQYSTHSVGGLSENDFICAAKVDALME